MQRPRIWHKVLQEVPSKSGGAASDEGGKKQPLLSEKVRIMADKATNSLIITAEKDDFQVLEEIITQLDIPRAMVYLECLIMEVNADRDFQLGTQWIAGRDVDIDNRRGGIGGGFGGGNDYQNIFGLMNPSSGVGTLPPGFSLGIFSQLLEIGGVKFPNLAAIVNAYKSDKDVHILSTPQILTTNNQEATITVGRNVPYQTKSGSSDVESFNTFEYRDVGITLKITPQISKDRLVRLQIYQNVERLDDLSGGTTVTERPTTLKRTIETTVIAEDQSTVVIGGLIDEAFSAGVNQVPCLGAIPLFGYLFKSHGDATEKTNLYVFITPRVVKSPQEAQALYQQKRENIDTVREGAIKLYENIPLKDTSPLEPPDYYSAAMSNPSPSRRSISVHTSMVERLRAATQLDNPEFERLSQAAMAEGIPTEELLIKKKQLSEHALLKIRSQYFGLPLWQELPLEHLQGDIAQKVPMRFLKQHLLFPIGHIDPDKGILPADAETDRFYIAVHNPANIHAIDDLVRLLDIDEFEKVIAPRAAILSAINLSHDLSTDAAEQIVQDMADESELDILREIEQTDLLDDTSQAPIIKLVNHIISQAIKARASDIHLEPFSNQFKVRYRVDGILYDILEPPQWVQSALVSRIKVMAKMNIAEKRLPQDNRIDVKVGDAEIDIRASTVPTVFGERVVLRLLNKSGELRSLSDLGCSPNELSILDRIIRNPNGIFLMTGPTGSGKTTTLYALLSSINQPDINIITIEDPVEYQVNGVNQIQVNPKIELTFAKGLRAIVRQDPDVILVGEIRDLETAEIAVQSALTGHLVLSTLHTNDAASAVTRLVDIGIEPFLISSSVIAIAAQRLVRRLCEHCKVPHQPDNATLAGFGLTSLDLEGKMVYQPGGCSNCLNTGYRGRIALFEIMEVDAALKKLILNTYDANHIKAEALKSGMITLRRDGINKVLEGVTTFEEVLRVSQ